MGNIEQELLDSLEVKIADIIRNWVKKNYGENEASDPSWDIKSLADEIANNKWVIYNKIKDDSDYEDIAYVLEQKEFVPTDEEAADIFEAYQNAEDNRLEILQDIVDQAIYDRERENK